MEQNATGQTEAPKNNFVFPKTLLRGAGQVMFQNIAWTGLFFLIGIFWGGYHEGLG
ncbi:MAG: urea transporter, partial [Alistipes sp.]|nr:urea transporter [Alistipes sp.]